MARFPIPSRVACDTGWAMSAGQPEPGRRLGSLDALRGIAVVLMVEQHVGVWLWHGLRDGETLADHAALVGLNALGGFGAPLFFALAGVGSALLARKGVAADPVLVRRGLVLLAFGYLVNLDTPSWFSWGSWFALHLIGFGMLVAPAWRRAGDRALLVGILAIVVLTPLVQTWLDTPWRLTNPRMRDVSLPGGPLRLALAESQYPILPWLAVYLAGVVSGRWIASGRERTVALLGAIALGLGAACWLAVRIGGAGAPEPWRRAGEIGLGWFPCSSAMVLLMIGLPLLLVASAVAVERRRPLPQDHTLVTLGRASLTVFIVHLPLFRELSRPLGLWHGLDAGPTLAVIAAFVVGCAVLSRWWRRVGYRGGAEWLLRRLGGG